MCSTAELQQKALSLGVEIKVNSKVKSIDAQSLQVVVEVENGEKPVLVEKGPFVYRQINEKKNVEFLGDKILSYSPTITLGKIKY